MPIARAGRRVVISMISSGEICGKFRRKWRISSKRLSDVLLARLSVPRHTETPIERKRSSSKGRSPKILVALWTMNDTDVLSLGGKKLVVLVRQAIHVRQDSPSRHKIVEK